MVPNIQIQNLNRNLEETTKASSTKEDHKLGLISRQRFSSNDHNPYPMKRLFSAQDLSFDDEVLSIPTTPTSTPPSTPPAKQKSKLQLEPVKKTFFSEKTTKNNPSLVKIKSLIDTRLISYKEKDYKIVFLPNKCGQHTQICEISSSTPLISGRTNKELLIKIFHEDCFFRFGKEILNFLSISMTQRSEILSHNKAVAEKTKNGNFINIVNVLNADTIYEDLFYIVEKLYEFNTPWGSFTTISSFSKEQMSIINQIDVFINYALNNPSKISLDLKSDNLAFDKRGNLTLIDFMEHEEEENFAFHLRIKNCFISLSFENKEVLNYYLEKHLNNPHFEDLYESIKQDFTQNNLLA